MRVLLIVLGVILLAGCGVEPADFTTEELEAAVTNGEDVNGKSVEVEVNDIEENEVLGYIIRAGDHLHLANHTHPEVEPGDTLIVTVGEYIHVFGEYTISYEKRDE